MKTFNIHVPGKSTESWTKISCWSSYHPDLGEGKLYWYEDKRGKSRVVRFFPTDWQLGCLYLPGRKDTSLDLTVEEVGKMLNLTHVVGEIMLHSKFRITNLTRFYLSEDGSYEEESGILKFSLKWTKFSDIFSIPFDHTTDDAFGVIQAFVWNRWPGCSLSGC